MSKSKRHVEDRVKNHHWLRSTLGCFFAQRSRGFHRPPGYGLPTSLDAWPRHHTFPNKNKVKSHESTICHTQSTKLPLIINALRTYDGEDASLKRSCSFPRTDGHGDATRDHMHGVNPQYRSSSSSGPSES